MTEHFTTIKRYVPGHPNATPSGNIRDYRLYASGVLGREIPPGVVVHHHEPTNEFVICQDDTYHKLLHMRIRSFEATGDPHKRKCVYCKNYDDPLSMAVRYYPNGSQTYYHYKCCNEYRKQKGYGRKERMEAKKKVEGEE